MFDVWPQLIEPRCTRLLEAAANIANPPDVAAVARLRRDWPQELVHAAVELMAARRKAAAKFEHPERMLADAAGMEQATSIDVARHKARRFADVGVECIADLCCGIGGDAMGLREVCDVLLVDHDPGRVWMARHNAGCPAAAADVTTLRLGGMPYHIDPDRRRDEQRRWKYEEMEPGPAFVEQLARGDGAVKLSPAVDFAKLPPGEVEIINRGGTLVQAVLWTGRLAQHGRTATRIGTSGSRPQIVSLHGAPDLPIPVRPLMRYLLAVDPAVERAGLMGALCEETGLAAIHPSLGLLTDDRVIESPWLAPFELLESMPWRPRRVKQWLDAHQAGIVEVKTRGGAVDPDVVQRNLRGSGNRRFTVFILRFDARVTCLVTRRIL